MGFNRLICELESACLNIQNSEREPFIATKRDNYCSIEFWLIKYILSLVPSVLERANVLLCKNSVNDGDNIIIYDAHGSMMKRLRTDWESNYQ